MQVSDVQASGLWFARIGFEAGPLSQWLHAGLVEAGLPTICIETRHVSAALKAMIVKTDKNDARGMAQRLEAMPGPNAVGSSRVRIVYY